MSYIYVIGTENQVKIGFSKTPEKRLKQLQTGNMNKLQLFYKEEVQDSKVRIIEHLIHRDLRDKKLVENDLIFLHKMPSLIYNLQRYDMIQMMI